MENINNENTNIMYFNNDDDFYKFCVVPNVIISQEVDDNGQTYNVFTFNFTDTYNSCVKDGKKFIIKDQNSRIFKNKKVSYKTITKPVENLEPYFGIDI